MKPERFPPLHLDSATTPESIEAHSFAIIDAEIPEPRPFQGDAWRVARRCIHTLGDTTIVPDLRLDAAALEAGIKALCTGCTVFTDTTMAAAGLPARRYAPLGVTITPLMRLPGLSDAAQAQQRTRAHTAMARMAPLLEGNIVAIGNAPTALLCLLDMLARGTPPPVLIVGMPVGFVNAAQAKELLHRSPWPHCTLLGRKGGSALAAACVNALAEIARERVASLHPQSSPSTE